jgi:hypothetical protein
MNGVLKIVLFITWTLKSINRVILFIRYKEEYLFDILKLLNVNLFLNNLTLIFLF